jgi:hypothetical protein
MTHKNRGRITVALGGAWRIYTTRIPATGRAIGTVVSNGETGALVYIERTGIYVRCNAGELSSLPQSKVVAAVTKARATHGGAGRGQGLKAADGAIGLMRKNISIDQTSVDALRAFGNGDLSLGVRLAASHLKSSKNLLPELPNSIHQTWSSAPMTTLENG